MSIKEKTEDKSMYCESLEHDACGVGCVVNILGEKSHSIVYDALEMLVNMEHRGATGADFNTGDGAGIIIQIPHDFYAQEIVQLPQQGDYGVAMLFFPQHKGIREKCKNVIRECAERMGFELIALTPQRFV